MILAADTLALFLAIVLATAALHKLVQRDRLTRSTASLLRTNAAIALPIMLAAAAIEAAAAIALLIPASRPLGGLLAAILWGGYAIALMAAQHRGDRTIDCGCSLAAHRSVIGGFAIARAFALATAALALTFLRVQPGGIHAEPLFAALALFALLLAAGEIAELPKTSRSTVR